MDESSTCRPPKPGTTPAGTVSFSAAGGGRVRRLAVGGDRLGRREDLDRDHVLERVGFVAHLRRHLHARPSDRSARGVEARLDRSAGADRDRPFGGAVEQQDVRVQALDRHHRGAGRGQLTGDHRAERRLVADGQKPRKRRLHRQRLVDPDLAVRGSEPRRAISRHRHDPVRRQRLGQLDVDLGVPVRVGRDRPDPERQHAEVLAQRARAGVTAAAAAVGIPFRSQHASADDALAVVRGHHLQRLFDVDRAQDVRRAVRGERQHAVVDGPQRDFARRTAALPILDVDADLGCIAGPILFFVRGDRHGETLRRVLDLELDVSETERRLAGIAGVARRRPPVRRSPHLPRAAQWIAPSRAAPTRTRSGCRRLRIGTSIDCWVDVSVNWRCDRMPSRSVVTSAVACSQGDWIMIRAVSPGL